MPTPDAPRRVQPAWDPARDQHAACPVPGCGHPYQRHFDSYEDMEPIGCKYCPCAAFAGVLIPEPPAVGSTGWLVLLSAGAEPTVSLHASERAARAAVLAFVQERWETHLPGQPRPEGEQAIVEAYFAAMGAATPAHTHLLTSITVAP